LISSTPSCPAHDHFVTHLGRRCGGVIAFFWSRPFPVVAGSPAHPKESVNHRVNSLPPLFPGFHPRDVASGGRGPVLAFLPDTSRIANDHFVMRPPTAAPVNRRQ
jgi:hypothetical protein